MRKVSMLMSLLAASIVVAGDASANNGWARHTQRMGDTIDGCMEAALDGLSRLSGGEPPQVQWHDATTVNLHVYSGNEVVFVQCSISPEEVCGEPDTNMTIHVLSDVDSPRALAKLLRALREMPAHGAPQCR